MSTAPTSAKTRRARPEPVILYGFGWPPCEMCVGTTGKLFVKRKPMEKKRNPATEKGET